MKSRRFWATIFVIGLLLGPLANPLRALTDEELFRDFQFNFLNPGARALGLGGAYIAEANDATAAEANPAALNFITKFELFAEFRSIQGQTQEFRSGAPVDLGNLPVPLPVVDLAAISKSSDQAIPSFISFVVPFKGARGTLAVSRQVVIDVTNTLQTGTQLQLALEGFPIWTNPNPDPTVEGEPPQVEQYAVVNTSQGELEASLVNYNLSGSLNFGDVSLGATATYATLNVDSRLTNTIRDPRDIGQLRTVNPRVNTNGSALFQDVTLGSFIDNGTDSGFAYTVGLHFHPDSKFKRYSPVKFGAVYRKGAKLAVEQTLTEDPGDGTTTVVETFENTLKVPDRYGIGVSGELGRKRQWVVSVDLERIEYSDLLEGFRSGVNFFTGGIIGLTALTADPNTDIVYEVDDATVVHFGLEYTLHTRGAWDFGFRGGYYNAPDSRIRMTRFNGNGDSIEDAYLEAFRGGESANHYTVGISANTPVGLQLQAAADFNDANDSDQFLLSFIYRFGGVRR